MKECVFEMEQRLPRPLDEVFKYFSDAHNLQAITPSWLHFCVLTPAPIVMKAGTRIDYKLRVHGFPLRWQSEITVWEPPHRFVDEQRRGPYRLWIHEHRFERHDEGTLCKDRVRYVALGGWISDWLLVRRDVERIFSHRQKQLAEIFPSL